MKNKLLASKITKIRTIGMLSCIPFLSYSQSSLTTKPGVANHEQWLWSFAKNKALPNEKALVDFNAIENWRGLGGYLSVSDNGEYFAYTINKPTGTRYWFRRPDSLVIQGTKNNWRQAFAISKQGFFSADGKQYFFQNGSSLSILQLGSKQIKELKDVVGVKPNAKNNWLAYQVKDKDSLIVYQLATGKEKLFDNITEFDFDKSGDWLVCKNKTKELLLYSLATGNERRFPDALDYAFSEDGKSLVVRTNVNLQYLSLPQAEPKVIWTAKEKMGIGNYSLYAKGKQVVFTIVDAADETNNTIGYYEQGMDQAVVKINNQTEGIPKKLIISGASFTDNGRYIMLSLQSKPEVMKPDEDKVAVEVWNHKDTDLQSAQSNQGLNLNGLVSVKDGKLVLLESSDKKIFTINEDFALLRKDYKQQHGDRYWERREDSCWIVSLKDGSSKLLPTSSDKFWFSPSGNYLVYFDAGKGCHYFSYDLNTGVIKDIAANVPANQLGFSDAANDRPPSSGNIAAWIANEAAVLVYDNYDIWKLDLTGKQPAINLTNGFGQSHSIVLNLFATDHYSFDAVPTVKANETLLLRAFNSETKESGFYRKNIAKAGDPELVYMGGYFTKAIDGIHDGNVMTFGADGIAPAKVKNANKWIVQRQSTNDAPNYYETSDFKNYRRLTDLQPQKNYQWLTAEVVSFKYLDGHTGQGILYKPENFDASKKYPVIIPFYGAFSNNMYQFPIPDFINQSMATGKSPIWFLNNGYLVFTPDMAVTPGKYGPKSYSVIEGAVQYLKILPYVDGNKLGCASHSWGAKLAAYNLTHSTSMAAIAITEGFFYADMINVALSPLQGKSRLEEIENGDYHYGNLWQNKDRWLDQTTVLNVDKAISPLLLLCNKESSPDYQDQTFQLFNALRRLDKNVWWLKYDNGNHTIEDLKERKDYTIRYTQFFDHYLKYAPAPQWMTQGVPYKLKGVESRYELDAKGTCNVPNGEPCLICQAWNAQYKKTPEMFEKEIKDWELDKDIAEELERKQNEKRKELDKEGEIRTKEVMRMLEKK